MFVLQKSLFGGKSFKKVAETKTKAEMRSIIKNNPKLAQNTHILTVTKHGATARFNNVRAFAGFSSNGAAKEANHGV